ncbi:hypothetical protein ACODT5_01370 [Streptomyces sp. 5.8]|uniref:hypothetical protein n=1 Tax=Streptomyces sp. 5.8 TaxID=3406571 RepID=UPI003BB788B2
MTNEWRDAKNAVDRAPFLAIIHFLGDDDLAVRAAKYLAGAGIKTIPQLARAYHKPGARKASSLLDIAGIGPGVVARIGKALEDAERKPIDSFDRPNDAAARRAFERITDRATEAYGLAIGEQPNADVRNAISQALHAVEANWTAAVLLRAAQDVALPLSRDQRKYLSKKASEIDPEIVLGLAGADGGR